MKLSAINPFIKLNYKILPRDLLAKKVGLSDNALRKRAKRMGVDLLPATKPATLPQEIEALKQHMGKRETETKLRKAKVTIIKLEEQLEQAFKIKRTPQTFVIKPTPNEGSEAVAFMLASDWHIEEEVRADTVDSVNEYNLEISEKRATKFFANGVKLIRLFKKDTQIKKLVLPLLGDFITNSLRDENLENNLLLPGDALWRVKSYLVAGIKYILANTDVEIIAVCHTGNHGRMTEKVHISTEAGNSLEKYMYRNLAEYFRDEPRIKFIIPEGSMSYIEVFKMTIRLIHGHQVKYAGGVGGITIPIRKALAQWNKVKKADLTLMGHYHQSVDGNDFLVNGSLIGYNAFAQFIKADYEEPKQTFFLIHNHNGGSKSIVCPIWLD